MAAPASPPSVQAVHRLHDRPELLLRNSLPVKDRVKRMNLAKRVDGTVFCVVHLRKDCDIRWVDWFNHRRLLEPIGYVPPAGFEQAYGNGRLKPSRPESYTTVSGEPGAAQPVRTTDSFAGCEIREPRPNVRRRNAPPSCSACRAVEDTDTASMKLCGAPGYSFTSTLTPEASSLPGPNSRPEADVLKVLIGHAKSPSTLKLRN
jgi:hypothetical protein